jgi:uncharacterized protein YndB with AHSA1/START domain
MPGPYTQSVETTAPPERIWELWSDVTTWHDWNPSVSSMTIEGPFAPGTTGTMRTPHGRSHRMQIVDVQPPRTFALRTSVIPGTNFLFRCTVAPGNGGRTRISQSVTIAGPLAFLVGPMAGNRVAADFRGLLRGLASKAGDQEAG